MIEKEYFTIAEFAAAVGTSKQAIYQRLNKSLKEFVKVEQGKKYIHRNAFRIFDVKGIEQDFQGNSIKVEQGVETDFLLKQIEEKDKQIEFLQSEIEGLRKLLENQQVLLLNEQQKNAALLPEETETKRGFFGLFRKGKKDV